jgi:hypothetical protein
MAKSVPYVSDEAVELNGVHIDRRMPFWSEEDRQPGWKRIPPKADFSPAVPYFGETLD